jgi:uncharacterized protein YdaU (DUF1376 family)
MLHSEKLLASELWALSDGAQFKAAMALWCMAWRQVPAASLPDDDDVLRSFSGLTPAAWRKSRNMALRGFVKCSDGRLYHSVLAKDALRAWDKRQAYQERAAKAAAARWERCNEHASSIPQASLKHPSSNACAMLDDAQGQGQGQGQLITPAPPPSLLDAQEKTATTATAQNINDKLKSRIKFDVRRLMDAVARTDLDALLKTFGCSGDREEWARDAAGLQFGALAAILLRAHKAGDPIRMPSGLRRELEAWRAMTKDQRAAVCQAMVAEIGQEAA